MKNLCGKTVTRQHAYEVWTTTVTHDPRAWTWYVLKKYQSPEKEATNPYARWLCDVVTPMCPEGETGDVYVSDIKSVAHRVENALVRIA
jgi:hypothetical protein